LGTLTASEFGSASILTISYAYIAMLGKEGIRKSTAFAILNANYLRVKLAPHYPILYTGKNGTVAHEMIADCRDFKRTSGVEAGDIAKRLIDFGFHAPTVSFPVAGTLMIEPTESEDKAELDRFIEAMITIKKEIDEKENASTNQSLKMIFASSSYIVKYHFPKPVKKVSNPTAQYSEDRKTITIEYPFKEYLESPEKLNFDVDFE